jgi:hypothetical protein
MDVTAGRSRFSRQTALFAHETVALVTWRTPNDLKVEALGARSAAPIIGIVADMGAGADREPREDFRQEVLLDRPWFIPRAFGDSITLMGVPEHAAVHPLASGATEFYRYAIVDSVTLVVPGRTVRAIRMDVRPKSLGTSLVAGEMWIDGASADVVRLVVVFIGTRLWSGGRGDSPRDSAAAGRDNQWANRFIDVEADVEYALIEGAYWLPHRQLLAITVDIPWFINASLPARAVSTFSNYAVNTSPELHFTVQVDQDSTAGTEGERVRVKEGRDTLVMESAEGDEGRYEQGYVRAGNWDDGRWEVVVPPEDSLLAFQWDREFEVIQDEEEHKRLRESLVSLANISEELPPQWIGRRSFQLAWENFADVASYNRVQGGSVGVGVQLRPGPVFTTVLASGRFAFGDLRPTASVLWRRDSPGGRLDLAVYADVKEVEPWTRGLSMGNSLNAMFAGHDDADYYLVLGSGFTYRWNSGPLTDVELGAYLERHESKTTEVQPLIPGLFTEAAFRVNPPVMEGDFARISVSHVGAVGFMEMRQGMDLLASGDSLGARLWASASSRFRVFGRRGAFTFRAGIARGDGLPQLHFRVGGPQTVRGYEYGLRRGREFWSAQLDYDLRNSIGFTPVLFADVGDTFDSNPLLSAGVGISLLGGLAQFNLSKGLRPSTGVRFDLVVASLH